MPTDEDKPPMKTRKKDFLQLRIDRDKKAGLELITKIEKVAEVNGLSLNDVANMAVAAGLAMVERKLSEIREHPKSAA